MRSRPSHRDRLIGVLLVLSWLFLATGTWAQSSRPRQPVRLPPAFAGTPLSFKIHAEAAYMAGRGSMIESVAIARTIHADAYAKELENSIAYVETYFRRQEINREERAKKNPRYLEKEKIRRDTIERQLKHQFESVLKGDVTNMMNWVLVELSAPTQSLGYLTSEAALTESESGGKLSEADLALIQFSDGRVTFSATDPKILETHWPFALRAESFIPLQKNFMSAREEVFAEIVSKGQASPESGARLIGSVNDLMVGLEKAYPREERRKSAVFSEYHPAKRYLASLAREVSQTIHHGDRSLFDETLRFEGGSLVELIWHMDRRGLVFASPPDGGGRVYRSLLTSMRNLFVTQGG